MLFGVSNLCWTNDVSAKEILDTYAIENIEIAPLKCVSSWSNFTADNLKKYEKTMNKKIVSIQSVLYGTDLTVTSGNFVKHMKHVISVCGRCDIPKIVFGSPKQRIINTKEDYNVFLNHFKELDTYCKTRGVTLCIEPNSKKYGCNFMTNIPETIKVLDELNCESVKLHIDTGNMMMENEDPTIIYGIVKYLYSVHISETYLGSIRSRDYHKHINEILYHINYNRIITLETTNCMLEQNIKNTLNYYQFKSQRTCLIGHTGFVGSNLLNQAFYTNTFNSKNIQEIQHMEYDIIYCCAVPGSKRGANNNPEEDISNINNLIDILSTVKCHKFVLISTIDVYHNHTGDELNQIITTEPYGKHRYYFEKQMSLLFDTQIIRLPGLFGEHLRKNILYDIVHNNRIEHINTRNMYQWYNLENLLQDIKKYSDIPLVNFISESISTQELLKYINYSIDTSFDSPSAIYNVKSIYFEKPLKEDTLTQIKQFYRKNITVCIIGAGWYGLHTGTILKEMGIHFCIYEKGNEVLSGASFYNQNRLHLGYHYPRSHETRTLCYDGYTRFKSRYPTCAKKLTHNYYCIADNSNIDYLTFKDITRNLGNTTEETTHELTNIQGPLLDTNEMFIDNTITRLLFKESLGNHIIRNREMTQNEIQTNNFTFVINCTNNVLNKMDNLYFEKTLSLVYEKVKDTNSITSYTIMDGMFSSIFPSNVEKNLYTLTDVEHTPLYKSYDIEKLYTHKKPDIDVLRILMEDKIQYYFPDFHKYYVYRSYYTSLKVKAESKSSSRLCYIKRDNNVINVACDKILGIFILEDYIKELL